VILGTRGSPLALGQSGWVRDRLIEATPGLAVEMQIIRTTGDAQQSAPPDAFPGAPGAAVSDKGIFVKEIEEALLEGRIDVAVHSLKDLPTEQPSGLVIACTPAREDPRDVLVTREGRRFEELPRGARLGTGSPRRAAQLLHARPDLVLLPVRGNVDTRVRKMKEGQFDGVILAAAGLSRLGLLGEGRLEGAAVVVLDEEICLPAVGQGALAIEARADDSVSRAAAAAIGDLHAAAEVAAERAFLAALGGGCRVPVAALARADRGGRLRLRGLVASPDGKALVSVEGHGTLDGARELGARLAQEAMERGADRLLGPPRA
jgi:hydroxymethylbilane synthase